MKKREYQISAILLLGITLLPALFAAAIDWIQYDERAVGENSPLYDDVVNRPAKQIFGVFTSEHNADGTHRTDYLIGSDLTGYATSATLNNYMLTSVFDADANNRVDGAETLYDGVNYSSAAAVRAHLDNTALHVSIDDSATATGSVWSSQKIADEIGAAGGATAEEYALAGNGSGVLASKGETYETFPMFGEALWTLYGIVRADRLGMAESVFKRIIATDGVTYDTTSFDFGKTADNRLYFTTADTGLTTWYSVTSDVVFTTANLGRPLAIGVQIDRAAQTAAFFYDGRIEAPQSLTGLFPIVDHGDHRFLGDGLDGAIYFLSVSQGLKYTGPHTPPSEGLSQCTGCLLHYDMQPGATLVPAWAASDQIMTLGAGAVWEPVALLY